TVAGTTLRTDIDVSNATPGRAVTIDVVRGSRTLIVQNGSATPLVNVVGQTPLRVLGAAQDLHLDAGGHLVSLLFNRPVTVADAVKLRDLLALTIHVPAASYSATRRNDPSDPAAELQVPGAALQDDRRIVLITFDKTLSTNATYEIALERIRELTGAGGDFAASGIVPRVDNDRPAAILTGKVLKGDNAPLPGTLVKLTVTELSPERNGFYQLVQYDVAGADGRYLFEYVPRDLDAGLMGHYTLLAEAADGKQASLDGAVRLPGEVHNVNLVFLGRGSARGQLRWEDGAPIPNWEVRAGSTLFGGSFVATSDANGNYEITGLPVGPLVFTMIDPDGAAVYAANSLRTAGEVLTQDLIALRKAGPPPGVARVRLLVLRSDTMQPVAGAQVGFGSPDIPLSTGLTDVNGRFEFPRVPAGLMSIVAADFSISRHSAAVEVELRGDQVLDQTLVLQIVPNETFAFLEGEVTRDDPAQPSDVTRDQVVPYAVITIGTLPSITANADGSYLFPDLPLIASGARVSVFDPQTARRGSFQLPTLVGGSNRFPIRLRSLVTGNATARVRLIGGKGEPVAGAQVFAPGYPPTTYANKGGGTYELADLHVPQTDEVYAVTADSAGPYGEQYVKGSVRVDFPDQIAVTELRLPGLGTVVAKIEVAQPCSTPPCYSQAIGPVSMTYPVWDDYMQKVLPKTVVADPDPVTNLVTFHNVPVQRDVYFATVRHPAGYAQEKVVLAYEGDNRDIHLRLLTIGGVSGRVFAHDGITPVAGASVRITTGTAVYAPALTRQDGSFEFAAIPANVDFNLVAEFQQDGIFRTGIVSGRTPPGGGPVANLAIVMRQQSSIEGRVLLESDGNPVPLAHYWLRELAWPYRMIGTPLDPLQADINGRFIIGNVFTGPFRITAVASDNQEIRGDYQGELLDEGDVSQRDVQVRIGGAGVGSISITVVDPLLAFEPVPNAEVSLLRGNGRFDFTTTNDAGVAFFEDVPAGANYSVFAFSKTRGRSGRSTVFTVATGQTASASVQLDFLGVVSGTLTDPDTTPPSQPVRGEPISYQGSLSLRVTSGAAGEFEFLGVPEGPFQLQAWELSTQRIAVGPAGLFISKLVPEQRNIQLEMERMGTLTVKVYLPNDTGGPGELAPLVEVTAAQCTICNLYTPDYPYFRSAQGSPVVFPRMFRRVGYGLEVRELGGEGRTVNTGGAFPVGALTHEQSVVLPQSGTVEVTVLDDANQPVTDAEVIIRAGRTWRIFTSTDGRVTLPSVPFGWYSVTAKKNTSTVAAAGELKSRSEPLRLTLKIGSSVTLTVQGDVDAEQGLGEPSIGTRVILTVASPLLTGGLRLEGRTDEHGEFSFSGIPVNNTTLSVLYIGPDENTIGARQSASIPNGSTGSFTLARVKLDATPPRVLSIDPPANSTNVSPSAPMSVTFSEPLAASFLTRNWFELIATDDGSTVQSAVQGSVRPDGTYVVTVTPPPPPIGQTFPLKSNVLYRFVIHSGIQDLTGLAVSTNIGTSFTTVNYTEPAVVKLDPPEGQPVPEQVTFRIKFNKPVDIASFDGSNGGVLTLERLDAYKGQAVENIPVSRYLDVADPTTIVMAPVGVAIAESSFYRIKVENVRDTQTPPNVQKDPRVFELFSFDRVPPVAAIVSPVAAGEKLVSGVLYSAGIAVTNAGSGTEASDVAYADWLDAAGVSIARVKTKPFAYDFVAPVTTTGTTFTLKATATDLSGNTSAEASFTWNVAPNEAPGEIVVTHDVASVYPSGRVESRVRFKDEGISVTVALELRGTALDGSELRQILGSRNLTRPSTGVEFGEAVFLWTAPLSLKDGTARVVATVTDSVNHAGSGETPIAILLDQAPPSLVSFLPKAENRYKFGVNGTVTIEVQTRDAETGIARTVFTVNGTTVLDTTSGTFNASTGITTFRKDVSVPPKNADTRVPIGITVYDQRGNAVSETHEVIYERVDDSTLPVAAWITPLDGAALPSNQSGWQATLRVQATDDVKVTAVRFSSSALAAPVEVTAPKSGTTDVFETKAVLTMPADGSPFTITATIADGDSAHDVELPITIDPVEAAPVINGDINITALTADQYVNKSLLVRGGVRVYISVPLTLKDLILVDGAVLSIPEETRLDVTVTGRLFVDADSRIDVSDKGYLGGLRTREDASFTNSSRSGRTLGTSTGDGTSTGGATNADGSHAGLGGSSLGLTNATYGSLEEPVDFGSGGAAQLSGGSTPGANGGGVVLLHGDRVVLAGDIHADSSSSASFWRGGAGGSVNLRARSLVTGARTRITANGSDQDASLDSDSGGGGGRIAVRVTERYEVGAGTLQARGGRNLGAENAGYVDGGAGTIFAQGRLLVSAFDERYPATIHRTSGTPLAGALVFDAIEIGPRALARFDVDVPANTTADPSAMVLGPADLPSLSIESTLPAAGAGVPQFTPIVPTYVAASPSGVREVRTILSVQPADVVTYPRFPVSIPSTASTIVVPSTTAPGAATLRLRVTDRAGRVVDSAPFPFNVIANTAPVIETLDVLPPDQIYAGGLLNVLTAARDDVAVKSLALTSSAGTVTSASPVTPTPQTLTRQFTVSIPPATPSNTSVVLTLSASDDFPGRAVTTATHSVLIRKDEIAPSATIVQPVANQQYDEGTGATFVVEVNASDAEVGVQRVTVAFEGVEQDLALVSGHWTKTLPVPNVEGSEPVAKTVVVKVFDYEGNVTTRDVTIFIKPLVDPNAPVLQWACSSPGAMVPAGTEITFRVSAVPPVPANGVEHVELTIGVGAPLLATRVGTSDYYEVKYTIPAGTTDGTSFEVRVLARSVAANEATLLGSFTAVTGISITTSSTIAATDLAFENQSLIVASGGVLTVVGPHQLRNVVVLSGGILRQSAADGLSAGALRVQRLYVSCGGAADVSATGFIHNTTYPGSGVSDYGSGGSHIGRAGVDQRAAGAAFGSVYEPKESGGGGNVPNEAEGSGRGIGGGAIRIEASGTITIDGGVKANGNLARYGPGAGGSVWLTTPGVLGGAGTIEAKGSSDGSGSGGGAIVLDYGSTSGLYTVDARGGFSTYDGAKNAAAGTIVRRVNGLTALLIDNKSIPISTTSATELPAFGRATVASVNGATVTLAERRWISPSLAGNRVRVYAPDGSVRGTYRIGAVTKHPSTVALDFTATVFTQDATNYSGYLMYSPGGRAGRRYVAVRKNGAQWQFDDDATFVNFTPLAGESLFASFTKLGGQFRSLELLRCGAVCGTVDGLPVLEVVSGQAVTDTSQYSSPAGPNSAIAFFDAGEIFLQADGMRRSFVLAAGAPSVALESLDGGAVNVQPGDRLRGVYSFDSIQLATARVVSDDLVESATAVQKDAASSLTGGNLAAPLLDPSKISIAYGLTGPVIVGAAGAVSDPDVPFNVTSRNGNVPSVDPPLFHLDNFLGAGTAGGLSVFHLENRLSGGGARAMRRMDGDGYLSFSPSQTTNAQVGLAPEDTRSDYAEVAHQSFRLLSNATYQVWANGANSGKSGSYAAGSEFRIEKTATSLRWFVDDVKVHEVTAGVPPSVVLDLSFEQASTAELRSIEYGTTGLPRSFHAKVAADGSFRVPIRGAGGDPVFVRALDRHPDPFESVELPAGVVPADAGVGALSFAPPEVTGGRTVTGTVTLLAPAGSQGALVELSSDNAVVTVPSSITIPAGSSSGTFTATTAPVMATVDANLRATYGSVGPVTMLRVLKDLVAPSVTVTSPAPNSEYVEGQATKIDARATVTDQDSGVKRAWATFDGQSYEMTLAAGVWSTLIPVPFIDGSVNVTKDLVVSAEDNTSNVGAAAPVPVVIKPVIDSAPPTIAWSCLSADALLPVGYVTPLRVVAKAPNGTNVLQKVEIAVTDPNGVVTTFPATAKGNDVYEVLFTIPDVADQSLFTLRATATAASGSLALADVSFRVVKGATEIKTNTTIASTNTAFDNKAVVVWEGVTVTIDGAHPFQRLVILGTLTHPLLTSVNVTATATYVSCTGTVNTNALGYDRNAGYPGTPALGSGNGGSHIGRGGTLNASGHTYGSVYRPAEAGRGGDVNGSRGGGVVRINAGSVIVDGSIVAGGSSNNTFGNVGGSGGSVWITTGKISGTGAINANGGAACQAGGGGALSIEYTDGTSTLPALSALSGQGAGTSCGGVDGGPGMIRVAGPASTYGDVTVDAGTIGFGTTELPSLGSGLALSGTTGATLVTDRAANIPAYFAGHWVRILDAAGGLRGTWRIATINTKTVTLTPNGVETISLVVGDKWQGIYRFDSLALAGGVDLQSADPIETRDQTINGPLTTSAIQTDSLHLAAGAVVRHPVGGALTINVTNELRIDAGATIDVSALGYDKTTGYPGTPALGSGNGGSHL
ncbi:MAG: Ig-like domain-containing protein, partial [Acidobacteriota bacterium]